MSDEIKRLHDIEAAVHELLGDHGPCDDADEDESRCTHPLCAYCRLDELCAGRPTRPFTPRTLAANEPTGVPKDQDGDIGW
jgi:hypothetical protein